MLVKTEYSMPLYDRFFYALILSGGLILTGNFALWWFNPVHLPHNFSGPNKIIDIALFLLLTYVVWHQIANEIFTWFVVSFMKDPLPIKPEQGKKVAFLTAFVPGSEPYELLEKTLKAMKKADYPHDTWLLDEGNDDTAKYICKKLGILHFTRKNKPHYNTPGGPYKVKTKGGNYNAWYNEYGHRYEFVAQLDVDFVPYKNFLTDTLGYFKDPSVAFVGTPQIYDNQSESWIVRGAAEQAFNFYGYLQRGLFSLGMTLFIGANHVVRTKAIRHIGGYSGHIVEDHLTGMHYYAKRWKSVYLPRILALGEGPRTWNSYFSQQMRWAYGLIDILFHHSPKVFLRMKPIHIINYFMLQQYYFDGIAQVIALILIALFFNFGIESTHMKLLPLIETYLPLLLVQLLISYWLQKYFIDPKRERGLLLRAKLLNIAAWPIYALAFIKVLLALDHTYRVTPKGKSAQQKSSFRLFLPHVVLGMISAESIAISLINHHYSPHLIVIAVLNSFIMFGFFLQAFYDQYIKNRGEIERVQLNTSNASSKNILINL